MNRFTATIGLFGLAVSPLPAEQFGLFTYEVTADDTVVITDYPEDATGEVAIPSEIEGRPVTEIGTRAFSACQFLTGITIPQSVTEIGNSAFILCTALGTVTIASSVRIDHHAFERCTELQSMVFLGDSPELGTCVFLDGRHPTITVVGRAPAARVHDGSLSIRFDPSLRGFGWSALTSTDLNHWTTDDVSLSEPDAEGFVTASVRMDGPSRFLRLVPRIPIQGGCHL